MESPQGPSGGEFQPAAQSVEIQPITPDQQAEVGKQEKAPAPARQEVHNPVSDGANQNAGAPQFDASQLPQPIQPTVVAQDPQDDQQDNHVISTPVIAEDKERIEPEWVNKAKSVVEKTKDDPYMQEKEVSRLQADYLKKRYGKDIKLQDS